MLESTEAELRGHLRFLLDLQPAPWISVGRNTLECIHCAVRGEDFEKRLDTHVSTCPWRLAMEASVEPRERQTFCAKCRIEVPFDPENRRPYCAKCYADWQRRLDDVAAVTRSKFTPAEYAKECPNCGMMACAGHSGNTTRVAGDTP